MGPTASGKSGIAMLLASKYPIEIISVDSALVYRGMDIGSAKPSAFERAQVVHHLIDITEPEDSYSAARFASDASALIKEVRARARLPLLVGGTMLYFRALQHGLDAMPGADAAMRAELEEEATRVGWPALHQQLSEVDPDTAARLAPGDSQRISRALEVYRSSGIPLSQWHLQRAPARVTKQFINLALMPSERRPLHLRIEARFDQMLKDGLLDEVRGLMARPGFRRDAPSMRAVGYRQAIEYLLGEVDASQMRERALAATRQLAKHQITWLRSMQKDRVFDCLAEDAAAQLVEAAAGFFSAAADKPQASHPAQA
jgi:tRNA dimethylallyltransferase